jgi:hypothetical protein
VTNYFDKTFFHFDQLFELKNYCMGGGGRGTLPSIATPLLVFSWHSFITWRHFNRHSHCRNTLDLEQNFALKILTWIYRLCQECYLDCLTVQISCETCGYRHRQQSSRRRNQIFISLKPGFHACAQDNHDHVKTTLKLWYSTIHEKQAHW